MLNIIFTIDYNICANVGNVIHFQTHYIIRTRNQISRIILESTIMSMKILDQSCPCNINETTKYKREVPYNVPSSLNSKTSYPTATEWFKLWKTRKRVRERDRERDSVFYLLSTQSVPRLRPTAFNRNTYKHLDIMIHRRGSSVSMFISKEKIDTGRWCPVPRRFEKTADAVASRRKWPWKQRGDWKGKEKKIKQAI